MKSVIILFSFCLLTSMLKAQDYAYSHFLHVGENQIKDYLGQRQGILRSDSFMGDFSGTSHKMLFYTFPNTIDKDELYNGWFFMTKNNTCFKYILWYRSDKFLNNTIKEYDDPNSGFKRDGQGLKWKKDNIEVRIEKISSDTEMLKTGYTVQVTLFKQDS